MVRKRGLKGGIVHRCKICNLQYSTKKFAKKCGAWCKKHKSCNLEIIKRAIRQQK